MPAYRPSFWAPVVSPFGKGLFTRQIHIMSLSYTQHRLPFPKWKWNKQWTDSSGRTLIAREKHPKAKGNYLLAQLRKRVIQLHRLYQLVAAQMFPWAYHWHAFQRTDRSHCTASSEQILTASVPPKVLKGMVELPLTLEVENPSGVSLVSRISLLMRVVI